jgi:predicted phosphodiesterase
VKRLWRQKSEDTDRAGYRRWEDARVRTVVVSDTHLGMARRRDLLRLPEPRSALAERVRGADHLVLLGDLLELREAPLREALADAEPLFRALGEALGAAGRVTIVPGNHDHRLARSLIEARRLAGDPPGEAAPRNRGPGHLLRNRWPGPLLRPADGDASEAAPATGPLATLAAWLAPAELRLAYPGLWLRDDVYATHGHYLDCHVTIPTFERLAIAATTRAIGRPSPHAHDADDYEAAVGPLYDLTYSLAQGSTRGRQLLRGGRSATVWQRLAGSDGRRRIGTRLLAATVLPAAVGALNLAGLGPLTADLSGPSLRRSALRAMATVARDLGVGAAHVVFGHTHRSGPWPRDDASEWTLPSGGSLINTGSWILEPAFLGRDPWESPYWPGTAVVVDDDAPPRLERLLDELPTGT